jgi:hypothetical protein
VGSEIWAGAWRLRQSRKRRALRIEKRKRRRGVNQGIAELRSKQYGKPEFSHKEAREGKKRKSGARIIEMTLDDPGLIADGEDMEKEECIFYNRFTREGSVGRNRNITAQ